MRVRGPTRPTSAVCANADTARGGKHLSSGQIQANLASDGGPLGECRMEMSDFVLFIGQAVVVSACIGALVMGLSLYFKWLPRLGPQQAGLQVLSAKALFEEGRYYDVSLSSGQRLPALQFEGLVKTGVEEGWSLSQFAAMRRADGGKVILRIDSVRVFEEVAQPPVGS